jgi:hypothetical protein
MLTQIQFHVNYTFGDTQEKFRLHNFKYLNIIMFEISFPIQRNICYLPQNNENV